MKKIYPEIAGEFRLELIYEGFIVKLLIRFSDFLPLACISMPQYPYDCLLVSSPP